MGKRRNKQNSSGNSNQTASQSMTQKDREKQNKHDLEVANELGVQYAKNVDKQIHKPQNSKIDHEFAAEAMSMAVKNKTQTSKKRDNIRPATDSNRFEK